MTDEYNERVKSDGGRVAGQDSNKQTPRGSKEVRRMCFYNKNVV